MLVHIFKTDIQSAETVTALAPVFDSLPQVTRWTVDREDIDNVLRIESFDSLSENDVIQLSRIYGFQCEPLQ